MPVKTKIYRVGGEVAEMDAIDARHTLQNHPSEWFQTAADAKAAAPKTEPAPPPAPAPTPPVPPAAPAPPPVNPVLEAKHRGGGSYSVLDAGGKEVLEKLTKADAETFNAMSEEEKAEYVKAEAADKS